MKWYSAGKADKLWSRTTMHLLIYTKKPGTCDSLSGLPSLSSRKSHHVETSWACIRSECRHPVGPEFEPSTNSVRSPERLLKEGKTDKKVQITLRESYTVETVEKHPKSCRSLHPLGRSACSYFTVLTHRVQAQ